MKKFILKSLFAAVIIAPMFTTAQITLFETDMSAVGDTVRRANDTLPIYGPGNAGVNQTWDFTTLGNHSMDTTRMVDPAATTFAGDFPGSNLAMTTDDVSYFFMSLNPTDFIADGMAGDLLGNGDILIVPFAPTNKLQNLPRTYPDNFTDTWAFDAEADGADFSVYRIRLEHDANVFDTVDAWGSLTLPSGIYDVLRVKRIEHTTDVVSVKFTAFDPGWTEVSNVSDTVTTYSWLTKNMSLAVAEMTFDSLGNPNRLTYYHPMSPPVGVEENVITKDFSVNVFPNPADDIIYLETSGKFESGQYTIAVIDMNGKKVLDHNVTFQSNHSPEFSVKTLPTGIYNYTLKNDQDKLVWSGKILVGER